MVDRTDRPTHAVFDLAAFEGRPSGRRTDQQTVVGAQHHFTVGADIDQ